MENALRMRDSFELLKRQDSVQQSLLAIKDFALVNCDQVTRKYDSLDRVNQLSETNFKDQLKINDKEKIILTGINTDLKGEVKRKNWAIVKISSLSVSIIGTLTYLLIKK